MSQMTHIPRFAAIKAYWYKTICNVVAVFTFMNMKLQLDSQTRLSNVSSLSNATWHFVAPHVNPKETLDSYTILFSQG